MVVQKPLFMLIEPTYAWSDMTEVASVMWHGLPMDFTMAGYLMALPAIWLIVSVWCARPFMRKAMRGYIVFAAALIVLAALVDAMLFPYWGFRLDTSPVFYFTTSPSAAMASILWWHYVVAAVAFVVLTWAVYKLLALSMRLWPAKIAWHRILTTLVMVIFAALLIVPIRGGVTVSTMAPGRVYFTDDMRLNRAALNPMFNFLYSATHIDRLGTEYRFFGPDEAEAIVADFTATVDTANINGIALADPRPDIYLVILESFSAHLMPTLGGEPVAMRLDSIAAQGVLFTDFYAESFRTDRALPTILSGMPAMPSVSVLRYADKFGNLPSLASSLGAEGYSTNYYYGGDINFTNLRGYLVATGFSNIISDSDFKLRHRLSKWGAPDEDVFARALSDARARTEADAPALFVVQTSSSHEPFDVPYHKLDDPAANAFAYADSCLGDFVNGLHSIPRHSKALIVMVPDHWGAYPKVKSLEAKHHVPLVLTGEALMGAPARIATPGSQSAIAPTLLALLGIDNSDFPSRRNLLSDSPQGQFAWYTEPDWSRLKTAVPADSSLRTPRVRAYLQTIYSDLERR